MKLGKLKAEDLIYSRNIGCTNTCLELNDYDWMDYSLCTRFMTEKYGELIVKFNYFGTKVSTMKVSRIKDGEEEEYEVNYPSEIFTKHITDYMKYHLEMLTSNYSFNGEKFVLDFYNEVIEYNDRMLEVQKAIREEVN